MISIFLGIVGFFSSSSDIIGTQLINAFSWMLTWFTFIGTIQFFMWAIVSLVASIGTQGFIGNIAFSKLFVFIASLTGSLFIGYIMLARTVLLIFLTYSLKNDIDKDIKLFSDLSQTEMFMIFIVVILSLFSKGFKPIVFKLNGKS